MTACVVCRSGPVRPFATIDARRYLRCEDCLATFVARADLPPAAYERSQYLLHRNDPDAPGYRAFLMRLVGPLADRLPPGCLGLDFGCGPPPGNALVRLMEEQGHRMRRYDPFFHPEATALEAAYDFVTCTEVVEHFHDPAESFARLAGLVRPGGWLALMTCFQTDDAAFADWHYRRDPTHVVFYRESTLRRVAADLGWSCEVPRKDVALMRSPS